MTENRKVGFEGVAMQEIQEFVNISPAIIQVTESVPSVDEDTFITNAQPGDIVASYTRKEIHPNLLSYFGSRTMGLFQGGLFTSLKMISTDNKIIGYGVHFGDAGIQEKPIKDWIEYQGGAILMRIPSLTNKQKNNMVEFLRNRDGLSYNFSQLIGSVFKRIKDNTLNTIVGEKSLLNGQPININDDRSLSKYIKQVKMYLKNYNDPLICSTVIYLALKSVGSKIILAYDPFEVWPRDFLISKQTTKICKFIRSEGNTNER